MSLDPRIPSNRLIAKLKDLVAPTPKDAKDTPDLSNHTLPPINDEGTKEEAKKEDAGKDQARELSGIGLKAPSPPDSSFCDKLSLQKPRNQISSQAENKEEPPLPTDPDFGIDFSVKASVDIEVVLRNAAEGIRDRMMIPTNFVIFVKSRFAEGDWIVGAYCNYDIPRDSADPLLDSIADRVAFLVNQHEGTLQPKTFTLLTRDEQAEFLGHVSGLERQHYCSAIIGQGQAQAVICLFRNTSFLQRDFDRCAQTLSDFESAYTRAVRVSCRSKQKPDDWSLAG